MWTDKTELFENAEDTLSVQIHSAQYKKLIQDGGRALLFLVFYTLAYFLPNFLFSSKFSFVNSSSWLFQEAAEHYQVTSATGVKRRKIGSPFSLTLFCPDFDILNCFCDFEERHNNINPHQTKFKDGVNLLFRGLLIANTSRVKHTQSGKLSFSNRFTVYVWTGENDAKTLRVDASVFENEKKNCVFKRIRIRVDRAWIKPTPAEIHGRARREELLEPFQIETSVPNWFRRRTFHVLMHCIRSGSWKVGRLNRALSFYAQCLLAFLSF